MLIHKNIFRLAGALILAGVATHVSAMRDYKPYQKESSAYQLAADTQVEMITVKFKDEQKFRLCKRELCVLPADTAPLRAGYATASKDAARLKQLIAKYPVSLIPGFGDPADPQLEQKNEQTRSRGLQKFGIHMADMNNYYSLIFTEPTQFGNINDLIKRINRLPSVEIAYAEPPLKVNSVNLAMPGASGYSVPSLTTQGSQAYLDNTSNGIHSIDGWKWKGGKGSHVEVMAVDTNINIDHVELTHLPYSIIWWSGNSNSTIADHGTAVAGILFAEDDSRGVTGIVNEVPLLRFYSARYCFIACWYDGGRALAAAADIMSVGDVITMSLGYTAGPDLNPPECNGSLDCNDIPVEWTSKGFTATQAAVANGIVVLASASNGYVNLDDPIYNDAFNLNVRDSGAIIVGATQSDSANGNLTFSNYGSRVTARAWGHNVATLGNGDPNTTPWDEMYTSGFGGTSSAAPIVAGAAASIQSIAKAMGHAPLTSVEMRDLISLTGQPQIADLSRSIGEMPNIDAAAKVLQAEMLDCNMSYNVAQSGGYGFHSVQVTNVSGGTMNGWTVYLDFDGHQPTVQWTSGATATVNGDRVMLESSEVLSPGENDYFSLGGQYPGSATFTVDCF